jgi:CRP/FNR family transcriptional regulator
MTEVLARRLAAVAPDWPEALHRAVAQQGMLVRCPDRMRMFGPGDPCSSFMLPLVGAVRVEHAGGGGRSIVLYRVGPGDSCVMTTACLLGDTPYDAWGYAEGAVEAVAVSGAVFRTLMAQDTAFRARTMAVFARRVIDLVEVIDTLLLHRTDLRLAAWLAAQAGPEPLRATHQTIATELGTAREVISRVLKAFEQRGWVALGRGTVTVLAPGALTRFAQTQG